MNLRLPAFMQEGAAIPIKYRAAVFFGELLPAEVALNIPITLHNRVASEMKHQIASSVS